MLYVTTRSGYKPGGLNSSTAPADEQTFGPEQITDVEAGWKSDFEVFGMKGRADLTAYHDNYSDIQNRTLVAGSSALVTTNLADAHIDGVEFTGTLSSDAFRALARDEADAYAASDEGLDKAGGYAVQGRAAAFVERIDGSYTAVVGLPLCELAVALRALGWR